MCTCIYVHICVVVCGCVCLCAYTYNCLEVWNNWNLHTVRPNVLNLSPCLGLMPSPPPPPAPPINFLKLAIVFEIKGF